jgi:hypothetical protein
VSCYAGADLYPRRKRPPVRGQALWTASGSKAKVT